MVFILQSISELIVLDGLINGSASHNYVHFLTHADDSYRVPKNWKSVIYTSRRIFLQLLTKETAIDRRFFNILELASPIEILLKDGKKVTVTMFLSGQLTGNVMFHFKTSKRTALYSGPFTDFRIVTNNQVFQSFISEQIDWLYIDNTRANSVDNVSVVSACEKIVEILKTHHNHKIFMNIPVFGYEDLIYSLVTEFQVKIFLDNLYLKTFTRMNYAELFESDMNNAAIVIRSNVQSVDEILENFQKHNTITLRIVESNYDIKNVFGKIGLFQVHWSPHPSLFQLYGFIHIVNPKFVQEIYSSFPKLPAFLNELCKSGRYKQVRKALENIDSVNKDNQQLPEDNKGVDIMVPEINSAELDNRKQEENKLETEKDTDVQNKNLERPIILPKRKLVNNQARQQSRIAIVMPTSASNNISNAEDSLEVCKKLLEAASSVSVSTSLSEEVKDNVEIISSESSPVTKFPSQPSNENESYERFKNRRKSSSSPEITFKRAFLNTRKRTMSSPKENSTTLCKANRLEKKCTPVSNEDNTKQMERSKGPKPRKTEIKKSSQSTSPIITGAKLKYYRETNANKRTQKFKTGQKSGCTGDADVVLTDQVKFTLASNYKRAKVIYISSDDD